MQSVPRHDGYVPCFNQGQVSSNRSRLSLLLHSVGYSIIFLNLEQVLHGVKVRIIITCALNATLRSRLGGGVHFVYLCVHIQYVSVALLKTGVCNHAALSGQMHITRLGQGPLLHVSSSAA